MIIIVSPDSMGICFTARASVCVANDERGNPRAASSFVIFPLVIVYWDATSPLRVMVTVAWWRAFPEPNVPKTPTA